MRAFLFSFEYDYYCQGLESGRTVYLVYASCASEAIHKIKKMFPSARNFERRTIE